MGKLIAWLLLVFLAGARLAAVDDGTRKAETPEEAYYFDRQYDLADADRPAPGRHPWVRSAAEVERARRNIAALPWAKKWYAEQLRAADELAALTEEQLRDKITDLPGSACSCPVCRQPSNIAWRQDQVNAQWDLPLSEVRITCQGCKTVFPNEKFPEDQIFHLTLSNGRKLTMSYYRGKRNNLNEGDRYFLSGLIRDMAGGSVLQKLAALADVCRISGDRRYAEAGRRILLRYAAVYPGYPLRLRNTYYPRPGMHNWAGKLYRWKLGDNRHMVRFVDLYDAIYHAGVLSDADKVRIENDLFREYKRLMVALPPLRDLSNSLSRGYAAMAWVGRTLGDHEMIDWVVNGPQSLQGFMGKWFHRDGFWHENTLSYQNMAMGGMESILKALEGYSDPASYTGRDRFDDLAVAEKLPMLGKAYLSAVPTLLPTGFLPAVNDCVATTRILQGHLLAARRYYDSPQVREACDFYLKKSPADGEAIESVYTFGTTASSGGERKSAGVPEMVRDDRLFPGPGWGLFRSGGPGRSGAALLLDFGERCVSHVHRISLNFLYCDYGTELITDTGYLSAQHKNTSFNKSILAHNSVMVDDVPHYQVEGKRRVRADFFSTTGTPFRVIRGSSPTIVPGQTERFERTLFWVDRGLGDRYVADFFESAKGRSHTYLLHGAGEDFEIPSEIALSDWEPGAVFDPATGVKKLRNGRMAEKVTGPLDFCWRDRRPGRPHTVFRVPAGLSYRFMTASGPGNRNIADPMSKQQMQILMLRSETPAAFFAGVVEGFREQPVVRQVEMLEAQHGRAMRVTTGDRVDLLLTAEPGQILTVAGYPGLSSTAAAAALSLKAGQATDLMAVGGVLKWDQQQVAAPVIEGTVTGFNEKEQTISTDRPLPPEAVGSYLFIPERGDGYYRIDRVSGKTLRVADTAPFRLAAGDKFRWIGTARLQVR